MENLNHPEASKIRGMFGEIAKNYDRANNTLSGGVHHWWRKKLVTLSNAGGGDSILDCATGTGDLAFAFKKQVGGYGKVVGIDFTPEMIELARSKAERKKLEIDFQHADVTKLPFADQSFHVTSISFGIRNVEDPIVALREMARVTRHGGSVMILEFGQPKLPVWKQCYQFYSKKVLPKLGGIITGKEDAYRYLEHSSAQFPSGETFSGIIRATGFFAEVTATPLSGGVAYVYKAVVA